MSLKLNPNMTKKRQKGSNFVVEDRYPKFRARERFGKRPTTRNVREECGRHDSGPVKGRTRNPTIFCLWKNEANDGQNLAKKQKLSRTGTNVRGIRNLEHVEASKLPKNRCTCRNEQRQKSQSTLTYDGNLRQRNRAKPLTWVLGQL